MYDILIRNGHVIDGTGQPAFWADVGVAGDIVRILPSNAEGVVGRQIIDASGCSVSPGFIDMHSHSDLTLLSDPRHLVKLSQGVTTEALGQDGLSYAPISIQNLGPLLYYLAAVNGHPPPDVKWESVKEFLDLFDQKVSCNVVYFVPHAAIRVEAMGWDDRPPSQNELRHMKSLAEQGMRDGAFGFSTGLTYVPGIYSSTSELVEICKSIRSYDGVYVTHSRYSLGDRLLDPFREAIDIGRQAVVPVQISHYHNPVEGMGERMVNLVDEGRNTGVDITFDQYPYPASSTLLLSLIPPWVHSGGPSYLLDRIGSADIRDKIKDQIYPQWGGSLGEYIFSHIGSRKNKEWQGRSLEDMAHAQGKTMVDTMCDLLLEENLNVAFVARTGNPDNINTILKHPAQMVGSDGLLTGDMPNPRTYGTFPYILGQVVREQELLTLEDAVRKMTSFPSQRLGLRDRGILRDGMKADIVVFDPKRVRAMATFDNPKQLPTGIEYVLVNGGLVIDKGAHTGLLPGRALRHS